MAKEFYQLIRSFGGLSLEYASISESDFSDTAGAAYTPPERGELRRITGDREIQLLSDAPGVVESFQTLAPGYLYLPANTVANDTNDAGNGRLFFVKNSGTQDLYIKDYLGNQLQRMPTDTVVIVVGNDAGNWDIFFKADDIYFDNSLLNWALAEDTIQRAVEYASTVSTATEGVPRYVSTCGRDGKSEAGKWLEFFKGVPSDKSPLVLPEDSEIVALSFSCKAATTVTYTLYKNNTVVLDTLSATGANTNYKSGLNHTLLAGDNLSVKVTAGVADDTMFCIFLRTV